MPKVWMITGCSSGLGAEMARQALHRGDYVAVTARDTRTINPGLSNHEHSLVLELDVAKPDHVERAVRHVVDALGSIDVLINNAARAYMSAVEEIEPSAFREIFDINLFGAVELMRCVLPHMRRRRSGTIVNVSSVASLAGFPALSSYCASKSALDAVSEALALEVAPCGINVVIANLAALDTFFRTKSVDLAPTRLDDYEPTAGRWRDMMTDDGNRLLSGSASQAAKFIIDEAISESPSPRLLIGEHSAETARRKADVLAGAAANAKSLTPSATH